MSANGAGPRRRGRVPREVPAVPEILAGRAGEEMRLNDRYGNPQMSHILRTLGFDKRWVGGEGAYLIDSRGDRYLDLFGGYGVFAIGRNHPEAVAAVREVMAARTGNMPQLGVTLLSGVLAEQLLARAPGSVGAMVPANTGTEAVEAAIKLARAATGRPRIVYADHGFHGLTLGSLSINGNPEFREGFGPLLQGFAKVPFGDIDELERELERGDVAGFVVEPVQGKGVNIPPPGYLQAAQRLCRDAGALFVCDEVQTGLGRTGRFLACEHWGLEPDVICLSKALSGGLVPIGATLVSRRAFDRVFDGMERAVRHGSTFGGNDLAAAAALATLRVLDREGLVERAERLGSLLLELTAPLCERHEIVHEVRGMGLIWAIELRPPGSEAPQQLTPSGTRSPAAASRAVEGAPVPAGANGGALMPHGRAQRRSLWGTIERAQPGLFSQLVTVPLFHRHHIFCQVAGHRMNVIKALPPLVVEEQDIHRFAEALDDVLARAQRAPAALALSRLGLRAARRRVPLGGR